MLDLNSLSPGSFNGASFLIESTNVQGGRKTIIHEFPNQDTRYVEDLGLLNETIQLNVTVPTADYFSNRDSIKAALEFEGYGTLIHPYYGVRTAVCQNYNIDEDTNAFGYVRISMTLIVGQELNFPGSGGELGSFLAVFSAVASMVSALSSSFYSMYPVSFLDSRAHGDLVSISAAIWRAFRESAGNYTVRTEFSAEAQSAFYRDLTVLELSPAASIVTSDAFISAIIPVTNKLDAITLVPTSGIDVALKLAEFVSPVPTYITTAAPTQIAIGCYDSLSVAVKIQALGILAKNIGIAEFTSTDQVQSISIKVQQLAADISLKLTELSKYTYRHRTGTAYPEVIELLDAVKATEISTLGYLTELYKDVLNTELLDVTNIPTTILTYSLYGDTDKDEDLRLLNFPDQRDAASLDGAVKIFTVK